MPTALYRLFILKLNAHRFQRIQVPVLQRRLRPTKWNHFIFYLMSVSLLLWIILWATHPALCTFPFQMIHNPVDHPQISKDPWLKLCITCEYRG